MMYDEMMKEVMARRDKMWEEINKAVYNINKNDEEIRNQLEPDNDDKFNEIDRILESIE